MRQGEVWLVNLDPVVGSEINKTRPCIIINDDSVGVLPLKVIAPVTEYKDRYKNVPWMVAVNAEPTNGLDKKSVVDVFQVRSVAEERLVRRLGSLEQSHIMSIKAALKTVFGC